MTWNDFDDLKGSGGNYSNPLLAGVTQIKFRVETDSPESSRIYSQTLGLDITASFFGPSQVISENYVLNSDINDLVLEMG